MSLATASSHEQAALGSSNGMSASDGLAAHDHQRNDESPMTNGVPQLNGQNVMAHNHSDPSRHLPVPDWEAVVSTIQQLQDIESIICSPESREGKVTLWDIIETSNKLVPALKQLETTYNERNDGLEKLQGEYRQAVTGMAEVTSKVKKASEADDLSVDQSLILQVKQLSLWADDVEQDCLHLVNHGKDVSSKDRIKTNEKISGLETENSDLQNNKIRLQSDLDAKEAACSKAGDNALRLQEDIRQLGREKTRLQSELDLANASLQSSSNHKQALENELLQLRRDKATVDAQLLTAQGDNTRLHDVVQKLRTENTRFQSNLAQANANLSTRNAGMAALDERLSRPTTEQQADDEDENLIPEENETIAPLEYENQIVEPYSVPAISTCLPRSKSAGKRNDGKPYPSNQSEQNIAKTQPSYSDSMNNSSEASSNRPAHNQHYAARSSASRDKGVTTKWNADIPSSSHRSRHHVEASEAETGRPVFKQTAHASRLVQSKRRSSSEPKAPSAKRRRTSVLNAPEIQGGQESEDDLSVALSIGEVGKPAFAKDPIPMAVWDRVRKQMGDWDRKRPKWRTLKDKAICPDAYARKKPSDFDYGLDYSCSHCRQHGDVCVVVRDGEMELRPLKDSAGTGQSSVGHWRTADLKMKA